ncbi:alkane 1-monooxygenase [Reichenbachiella carrageenanivorans]|uniref:Alkane 1-monooxygenase n=1 Tax=Reichenbachiella carrageenanivorans TaxID=2979869 RepID=A0ABY6CVN1_9BACT|nr:alkane 1-monooxygenase [Reichenbachiella carrageenanivorans]UXX77966.1 alkane 1-monooxygenase [Reichenbachiella carrageenanivorans]
MNTRFLKYSIAFIIPLVAYISIQASGWWTFATVLLVYVLLPLFEFLFAANQDNLIEAEEELVAQDPVYDYLLYLVVPVQFALLYYFVSVIGREGSTNVELIGRVLSMGITCGALGINVAHELGHRKSKFERFLAKALLLSSLYMHFNIEHNRGHHKNVSTHDDPSSARRGEWVFAFWVRSIVMGYRSAWRLEASRLQNQGQPVFSFQNEMLRFQTVQLVFVATIYAAFGWLSVLCFVVAALIGILQLETVNYIEHYGLSRSLKKSGQYERVQPWHSWNSNHTLGRLFLFELSRHSDHHYMASRKYQILRHHEASPQMPTGYPGMMLLSLVPPLWFKIMHEQIANIQRVEG